MILSMKHVIIARKHFVVLSQYIYFPKMYITFDVLNLCLVDFYTECPNENYGFLIVHGKTMLRHKSLLFLMGTHFQSCIFNPLTQMNYTPEILNGKGSMAFQVRCNLTPFAFKILGVRFTHAREFNM